MFSMKYWRRNMTVLLTEALSRVAEATFEQLAFLFPEPGDLSGNSDDCAETAARIRFSGAFSGELIVALSTSALAELADNMLGLDDGWESSVEQQHDAFREVLNVLCGNLLPELAGSKAVFDLAAPEVLDAAEYLQALEGRTPRARVRMGLDEGHLDLVLFHEDMPPDLAAGTG